MRLVTLMSGLGARYRAKQGKRWRSGQSTPRIGLAADTRAMEAQIDSTNRKKGLSVCDAVTGMQAATRTSARSGLSAAPYINFLQRAAPGGFCHLCSERGIMDRWLAGSKNADCSVAGTEEFRDVLPCLRR